MCSGVSLGASVAKRQGRREEEKKVGGNGHEVKTRCKSMEMEEGEGLGVLLGAAVVEAAAKG